jgi:hypothetical protein
MCVWMGICGGESGGGVVCLCVCNAIHTFLNPVVKAIASKEPIK